MDTYLVCKRLDDLKNLNPKPKNKEFQRIIVKSILQSAQITNGKRKVYCVIDSTWFNQWKKYVEFDQHQDEIISLRNIPKPDLEFCGEEENEGEDNDKDDVGDPGKIDNIQLVDDPSTFLDFVSKGNYLYSIDLEVSPVETLELKKDLKKGVDFEMIPSEAWEFLLEWYGGYHEGFGPCIPRFGINNSEIDLFPFMIPCSMNLSLIHYWDFHNFRLKDTCSRFSSLRINRYQTLKDILSILKWIFKINDKNYPFQRLWLCYLETPWNVCYSSFGDKTTPGFDFEKFLIPYFETGKYQIMVEIRGKNQKFILHTSLRKNHDLSGKLEDGEDVGITRITDGNDYFGSFFHCISKTKCLMKYFTKNEKFLEEMKKHFKDVIMNFWDDVPKQLDKVFGDAMMRMWIQKHRFLSISGLKRSICFTYPEYQYRRVYSPVYLYRNFIKLLESEMKKSQYGENINLIEKNFTFLVNHQGPDNNIIPEMEIYFPVIYNKPITVEPIEIHAEYNLKDMIQDTISRDGVDVVSLPNVLVIGETSYRDRFSQDIPLPKQIDKVKTPFTLKPFVFGEKHRKTAQLFYELYGVIYYNENNEFNHLNFHTGKHFCRVKVPNVDLSYLSGEKILEWYEFIGMKMSKLNYHEIEDTYFSSEWKYSGGKKITSVPVMWFYQKKRDLEWDDPELFEGRVSYLKNQCCSEDSKVGCNMKLCFSGTENVDIFVPFVFVFVE